MTKTEAYKGFTIAWREDPPLNAGRWTANVASDDRRLNALMRRTGAEVINGRSCEEMIAKAKQYIDGLFGTK